MREGHRHIYTVDDGDTGASARSVERAYDYTCATLGHVRRSLPNDDRSLVVPHSCPGMVSPASHDTARGHSSLFLIPRHTRVGLGSVTSRAEHTIPVGADIRRRDDAAFSHRHGAGLRSGSEPREWITDARYYHQPWPVSERRSGIGAESKPQSGTVFIGATIPSWNDPRGVRNRWGCRCTLVRRVVARDPLRDDPARCA